MPAPTNLTELWSMEHALTPADVEEYTRYQLNNYQDALRFMTSLVLEIRVIKRRLDVLDD